MTRRFWSRALLSFAALANVALAQSFNIDVGSNTIYPVPAAGAAAAVPCFDLGGAATAVTVDEAGGSGNFSANNAGTLGDDQNLMDDAGNVGGVGATSTWFFAGLTNGLYEITPYAWAPDNDTYRTRVTVFASTDPVGGAWPVGGHAFVTTYSLHRVTVTDGDLGAVAARRILDRRE
jgi:hypothetical protein